jgi:hypothetical protein
MKRVLLLMLLLLGLAVVAAPVQASMVKFDLGTSFPGSTAPDPSDSSPWLTAVFEDGAAPGAVKLTLSAHFGAGKLLNWYINLDPAFNPANLIFSMVSGESNAPYPEDINKSADAYNVGGDGFYDVEFIWCSG